MFLETWIGQLLGVRPVKGQVQQPKVCLNFQSNFNTFNMIKVQLQPWISSVTKRKRTYKNFLDGFYLSFPSLYIVFFFPLPVLHRTWVGTVGFCISSWYKIKILSDGDGSKPSISSPSLEIRYIFLVIEKGKF